MTMRVSPPKVFPAATGAGKPPMDAMGSADAFRQTGFVLGEQVAEVLAGLNLEGGEAGASAGSRYRSQMMVSALGLWSRSWLSRLDALHAIQWGNYVAAVTLIRAAADHQAGELYLLRSGASEWQEWLDGGGISIAAEQHATQFRLHAFRAAEVLAAHEVLGRVYRTSMDLSLSHFGSTLLFAGAGSRPENVEMTFGDRDFHMGLAELLLGWLLELGASQLEGLTEFEGTFAPLEDAARAWVSQAAATVSGVERCRIEAVELGGERRYLMHNWRREPRSAPKRLLL